MNFFQLLVIEKCSIRTYIQFLEKLLSITVNYIYYIFQVPHIWEVLSVFRIPIPSENSEVSVSKTVFLDLPSAETIK